MVSWIFVAVVTPDLVDVATGGERTEHAVGVDAALEAVARVGVDPELAPGRGGAHRVEIGGLDEDVLGGAVDARDRAAHHADGAVSGGLGEQERLGYIHHFVCVAME